MEKIKLAWLAGLLEGEGCFRWDYRTPRIMLRMTDRDVVQKAALLCKRRLLGPYVNRAKKYKPAFQMDVSGLQAIQLMKSLLPFMHSRRSAKIKEILTICKARHQTLVQWHATAARNRKGYLMKRKPEGRFGNKKWSK